METKTSNLPQLIDKGLELIKVRIARAPEFGVFDSVEKQLLFLKDLFARGAQPNAEDKKRLTLGVLAVREFEDNDPEMADVLFAIDYAIDNLK